MAQITANISEEAARKLGFLSVITGKSRRVLAGEAVARYLQHHRNRLNSAVQTSNKKEKNK